MVVVVVEGSEGGEGEVEKSTESPEDEMEGGGGFRWLLGEVSVNHLNSEKGVGVEGGREEKHRRLLVNDGRRVSCM